MKTDLVIISILMVAFVFLPFYLIPLIKLRNNKKFSQIFKKEAEKFMLNLDIKESWNLNIAGIDSAKQKLLVVQDHEEVVVHHFDLKEIKQTKLHISTLPVIKNGKPENLLQRVEIEFSFYTKQENEFLCLYDYDLNSGEDLEVKNAEKLHNHLQRLIMAHPVIKRTA